ncbi:MAG: phosphatase PAP2 family protein [Gammaproteobacteria bacterium]|nr:phosphatase PAP2 family protein [Gammaproteobacteria bacterium]
MERPRIVIYRRWLSLFCLLLAAPSARSDEITLPDLAGASSIDLKTDDPSLSKRSFGQQLVHDTRYMLSAPARWDADDWKGFGVAAALVIGTGALMDKREGDGADDEESELDRLASNVERFGGEFSAITMAGFYAGAKLFDSPRAAAVAEDGLTASIIASVIITPLTKWTIGRVRPSDTADNTEFHPFGHNHSFPSGHTTQAFALASVIGAHYDSPWVDTAAYTTATLVGYARHQHNAHWPSDIVAGALIGFAVGQTVVRLNDENRGAHLSLQASADGPMLAWVIPFH